MLLSLIVSTTTEAACSFSHSLRSHQRTRYHHHGRCRQLRVDIHVVYIFHAALACPPTLNLSWTFLVVSTLGESICQVRRLPTKHRPRSPLAAAWSLTSPLRLGPHVTAVKSTHPSQSPKAMLLISCSASPYEASVHKASWAY